MKISRAKVSSEQKIVTSHIKIQRDGSKKQKRDFLLPSSIVLGFGIPTRILWGVESKELSKLFFSVVVEAHLGSFPSQVCRPEKGEIPF